MTQEDKKLLLKDLCGRLPYGVRIKIETITGSYVRVEFTLSLETFNRLKIGIQEDRYSIKPYLRPISSMTESEIDKLFDILHIDKGGNDDDWIKINDAVGIKFFFPTGKWIENVAEAYDYLNSIHIDYRGLIPMGLALEAKEGMYD